ncbi:unnamed protein product [Didymodactylos carnosus]|uniref:BURP domain-containing protein n=1 Tax=Didymodactylos carnosus TaxID=1234261 RepID=A0A814L160_9BILA|nr:unnamed protein product [Didymodactylos carnosus]CAF1188502.1 unnamed protein product [Didymodactylos carnosus]CAF3828075.1 unnamed protein product [Didymodactylos carnosus]CAF3999552.1 unnamed protein product [Didymodactylos carnosus]
MGSRSLTNNILPGSEGCMDECTGWYHSPEDISIKKIISMGGVLLQMSNHVLANGLVRCDLKKAPICNRKMHMVENAGCFYDYKDITTYSEHVLQTRIMQVWYPDIKLNLLPFPETFDATVLSSNIINGCEDTSVVCHDFQPLNSCSPFFVCHSKNGTKAYEVIIANKLVPTGVKMISLCHYQTSEFDPNHIAWKVLHKQPGDPVCHFTPLDSFLLCKKV